MAAIHVRGGVSEDGTLTIRGLPALAGHSVDVSVREQLAPAKRSRYPLRGLPIRYDNPFDSVAEEEWDALR